MEFECQTEGCSNKGGKISIATYHKKYPKGAKPYVVGTQCPECKEYMEDITPFRGWGNPKTPSQHRGKNFFDRGKESKIHQ
jgi:hypothetical protein